MTSFNTSNHEETQSLPKRLKPLLQKWRIALYEGSEQAVILDDVLDLRPYSHTLENWNETLEPHLMALIGGYPGLVESKVAALKTWFELRLSQSKRLKNATTEQPNLRAAALELQALYQTQLTQTLQRLEELVYILENAKQIGEAEIDLSLNAVDMTRYKGLIQSCVRPCVRSYNAQAVTSEIPKKPDSSVVYVWAIFFVILVLGLILGLIIYADAKTIWGLIGGGLEVLFIYVFIRHPLLLLFAFLFGSL